MRMLKNHVLTVLLLCSLLVATGQIGDPAVSARAQSIDACGATIVTFGAALGCIDQIAAGLRQTAKESIDQGNSRLVQQQILLAGTLEALVKNLRESLKDVLDVTFKSLDGARQNAFTDLMAVLQSAKDGLGDVSGVVDDVHLRSNQLLDRIPLLRKEPALFGIVIKNFRDADESRRADIEIRGYRLSDPALKFKKPTVKLFADGLAPEGEAIDSRFVAVFYGGLNVEIPNDLKSRLNFVNDVCAPRQRIRVSLDVPYLSSEPFLLLFSTSTEKIANLGDYGLPGDDVFQVTATFVGERTVQSCSIESYSRTQGQVNVGCEAGASSSIDFTAPAGARELTHQCSWVDDNNLRDKNCTSGASGVRATASGDVRGLDKRGVVIKDCPGGGHGALRLSGSYKLDSTSVNGASSQPLSATMRAASVEFVQPVDVGLPPAAVAAIRARVDAALAAAVATSPLQVTQEYVQFGPIRIPVGIRVSNSREEHLARIVGSLSEFERTAAFAAPSGLTCDGTEPLATTKWKQVVIEVKRVGCPLVYDTVSLALPMAGAVQEGVSQTSAQGRFKATVRGSNVVLSKVN